MGAEGLLGLLDVAGNVEPGLAGRLVGLLAGGVQDAAALVEGGVAGGFLLSIDFGPGLPQRLLVLAQLFIGAGHKVFGLPAGAFGGGLALGQHALQRTPETPAQEEVESEDNNSGGQSAPEKVGQLVNDGIHLPARWELQKDSTRLPMESKE